MRAYTVKLNSGVWVIYIQSPSGIWIALESYLPSYGESVARIQYLGFKLCTKEETL